MSTEEILKRIDDAMAALKAARDALEVPPLLDDIPFDVTPIVGDASLDPTWPGNEPVATPAFARLHGAK